MPKFLETKFLERKTIIDKNRCSTTYQSQRCRTKTAKKRREKKKKRKKEIEGMEKRKKRGKKIDDSLSSIGYSSSSYPGYKNERSDGERTANERRK